MKYYVLKKPQKWRWDGEKPYSEIGQLALAGFCGSSYGYLEIFDDEETIRRAIKDFYCGAEYFEIKIK